jgi:transporter family-2 protein
VSWRLSPALPLSVALLSGAMVALQQRLNGDLGRSLHDPLLAAFVSFGTGLLLMTVLVLRPSVRTRLRSLSGVPWWVRLGGLGGATLVAVGAAAAPQIGIALLTVGLVSGSTMAALVVDRFGIGPGGRRSTTGPRVAGALLCLLAIAVSAVEGLRAASPVLLLLVVLAGVTTSVQLAFNGQVRQATDATVATFVNFFVGAAALLLALGVRELVTGVNADRWPAEWWLYLGGPMGAVFVATAAIVVRSLGVLRFGLAVTAGQLLGGMLLDVHRGLAVRTVLAAALTMVAVVVSGRGQQ